MDKKVLEQKLIDAGLSKEPFTAELQLLTGQYGEPTNELLRVIYQLKLIVIFQTFGDTEGEG